MIDKLFLSPLLNNSRVYERTKRRASSLPCGQTRRLKSISVFWKSWKCVSNKKSQRHSISHRKGSVGMRTVGAKPSKESLTVLHAGKTRCDKSKCKCKSHGFACTRWSLPKCIDIAGPKDSFYSLQFHKKKFIKGVSLTLNICRNIRVFHAVIYYTYNIYLMFLFIRLFTQQIFPVDSIIPAPKKRREKRIQ